MSTKPRKPATGRKEKRKRVLSEGDVEKALLRACQEADPGCVIRKGDQITGWPDRFIYWSTKAPWGRGLSHVECKAPKKPTRPKQDEVHNDLERCTGVRPVVLDHPDKVARWIRARRPEGTILFR